MTTKVKDIMTRNVETARPDERACDVARRMAERDFGFMPVCDGGRVIGTITDRDLTIRVLASSKDPATPIGEVMTREATVVREDDDADELLSKMADEQIRRAPVVNDVGVVIGVVSLGDLTHDMKPRHVGAALADISKPRGAASLS